MTTLAQQATQPRRYGWSEHPAVVVTVHGQPATQGSKKDVGLRRRSKAGKVYAVPVEDNKNLLPWRTAVTLAARQAHAGKAALTGPLYVTLAFTLPKPPSYPKRTRSYPDKKSDADKLTRAVFDALTHAAVWEDDGRVIEHAVLKAFPGEHPDALEHPGAVIRIYTLSGDLS